MEVCEDLNKVSKLLPAILDRVTETNRLEDIQGLLTAIGLGILQNDIAFYLMLDIGRFYSLDSISSMRYERESMDFRIIFSKLFKGKGTNFSAWLQGKGFGTFPVLASHLKMQNQFCSTLGHDVKNRISQL